MIVCCERTVGFPPDGLRRVDSSSSSNQRLAPATGDSAEHMHDL